MGAGVFEGQLTKRRYSKRLQAAGKCVKLRTWRVRNRNQRRRGFRSCLEAWADGGTKVVAYVPVSGGYSLLEYAGGPPREFAQSPSLEEIQAAFANLLRGPVKSKKARHGKWLVPSCDLLRSARLKVRGAGIQLN